MTARKGTLASITSTLSQTSSTTNNSVSFVLIENPAVMIGGGRQMTVRYNRRRSSSSAISAVADISGTMATAASCHTMPVVKKHSSIQEEDAISVDLGGNRQPSDGKSSAPKKSTQYSDSSASKKIGHVAMLTRRQRMRENAMSKRKRILRPEIISNSKWCHQITRAAPFLQKKMPYSKELCLEGDEFFK
uniref:Uncharacterized protein n=1 Tax=Romanomermis culicivorax TaxID=13658 RepID=A0A915I4J6_ROMCU